MSPLLRSPRVVVAVALTSIALSFLTAAADDVLVRSPDMVITRADWDAELTRLPEQQRLAFTSSAQRVQVALNNVLVNRTLAARAREKGLDKDPLWERRVALETERFLAALYLDRLETEAGTEFDSASERNLARARELYLINPAKYSAPEQIDVVHILFDTTKRGNEAALAAAKEARAKIVAGADMGALAKEVSDDASAAKNAGKIPAVTRGKTDPAFEQAAFALKNPGDLSEPVLSRYGYHIVKLESRKPARQRTFDEARREIVGEMRQKYIADAREAAVRGIRSDARIQVNQDAVEALVVKVEVPPTMVAPTLPTTAPPRRRGQ